MLIPYLSRPKATAQLLNAEGEQAIPDRWYEGSLAFRRIYELVQKRTDNRCNRLYEDNEKAQKYFHCKIPQRTERQEFRGETDSKKNKQIELAGPRNESERSWESPKRSRERGRAVDEEQVEQSPNSNA